MLVWENAVLQEAVLGSETEGGAAVVKACTLITCSTDDSPRADPASEPQQEDNRHVLYFMCHLFSCYTIMKTNMET